MSYDDNTLGWRREGGEELDCSDEDFAPAQIKTDFHHVWSSHRDSGVGIFIFSLWGDQHVDDDTIPKNRRWKVLHKEIYINHISNYI